jgi:hypothetical protein
MSDCHKFTIFQNIIILFNKIQCIIYNKNLSDIDELFKKFYYSFS